MAGLTSISQLDLGPLPGKKYFNLQREWREEFIYFLMVDRFHDDTARSSLSQAGRAAGIQTPDNAFYGGNIKGITQNLDYIAGLGCTAIWLSPVFENNAGAYHGYNISNYLEIDPHFGTKQDLIELVEAAHGYERNGMPFPIRIILDVVINHSGDNWFYPGDVPYYYSEDQRFSFGDWRRPDRPIPVELRNPELYHRKSQIASGGGWDNYPERQHGDVVTLKDYANDDDSFGSEVINTLIKAHCYWIREADIDGFRVDAVKHMGEVACARFCSNIREYAYALGKRNFFLFGEAASADDDLYNGYLGQNTSVQVGGKTVFFGINSLLDFRLAAGIYNDDNNAPLRDIVKGNKSPATLFNRLEAQRNRALNRGEMGRYLVTFVDNHDGFWQGDSRFGSQATDAQIIAAVGYLLCALGTPCIYYGTEQGFSGSNAGDNGIREAMFDLNTPGRDLLNPDCTIYREIAKIAAVMRGSEPIRFGRMYYRELSGDGANFGLPYGSSYTLAFSRLLYEREVLIAFNVSDQDRNDCVLIDATLHQPGETLAFLYGGGGTVKVESTADGVRFVRLPLKGRQFVILE